MLGRWFDIHLRLGFFFYGQKTHKGHSKSRQGSGLSWPTASSCSHGLEPLSSETWSRQWNARNTELDSDPQMFATNTFRLQTAKQSRSRLDLWSLELTIYVPGFLTNIRPRICRDHLRCHLVHSGIFHSMEWPNLPKVQGRPESTNERSLRRNNHGVLHILTCPQPIGGRRWTMVDAIKA